MRPPLQRPSAALRVLPTARRPAAPPPRAAPALPAGVPTVPSLTGEGDALMALLLSETPSGDAFVSRALAAAAAAGAAGATGGTDAPDSLAALAAEAVLTDAVYAWSLAAAYLSDGALTAALAAAPGVPPPPPDPWRPATRCVLLPPGAGAYSLGSMAFDRIEAPAGDGGGVTWGGADSAAGRAEAAAPPPPLEQMLGTDAAARLMHDEKDTPARLSIDGAARTFALYVAWGYRSAAPPASPSAPPPAFRPADLIGEGGRPRSGAARRAADRHLGALFGWAGEGEEGGEGEGDTITTLARWRHMTVEARRYGGALAAAEAAILAAAAGGGRGC